jgi:hypothetical protein
MLCGIPIPIRNLFSIILMLDISRREFFGEFQSNPEYFKEELERLQSDPTEKEMREKEILRTQEELGKPHEFKLYVTHYSPKSGLFTASINDRFGESVAMGRHVAPDRISFLKMYKNEPEEYIPMEPLLIDRGNRGHIRLFDYFGNMFTIFSEVCASGKYRNHFEHERTGGI